MRVARPTIPQAAINIAILGSDACSLKTNMPTPIRHIGMMADISGTSQLSGIPNLIMEAII